ncbi:MAG: endo alpha-1,4 polygalactosaminidase [Polyangiales bacterium]
MAQSVAFFYGPRIPEELLTAYDLVVVEPAQGHTPRAQAGHAELVAYLSVGEVSDASGERAQMQPAWVLGRNEVWRSSVMDAASPEFQRDLIERRFELLWRQGYRTLFLDTLDSYQLIAKDDASRERQRAALVSIIQRMREKHPGLKLFLNRGFELLDALGDEVRGVVAESLFSTWSAETGRYQPTDEEDRAWLLARLDEVRKKRDLPIVIIDYVALGNREVARATAQKIVDLGYTPWVSDQSLMGFGVGVVEIVNRRVLVVTQQAAGRATAEHPALRYLTPALEHLGYVVEHHDLSSGLPQPVLGSLAGIVSWLDGTLAPRGYGKLLRAQLEAGTRLVVFGAPGLAIPGDDANALGFANAPDLQRPGSAPLVVETRDVLARDEAEPTASPLEVVSLRVVGPEVTPHLTFRTGSGAVAQALMSTSWGAWIASHYFAPRGTSGELAWTIDIVGVLTKALRLTPWPIPDVTTENGGRLAMFVVRGQGLGEPSRLRGRPSTANVLRELIARFPVPHALDLETSSYNAVSGADRAAALGLTSDNALVRAEGLPPGRSKLTAQRPWTTQLAPLAEIEPDGTSGERVRVHLPMAGDYDFIPHGAQEAYPYRACEETIQLSDTPRRRLPVALDYHASSLASDGGHRAIASLYGSVLGRGSLPIRLDAYAARVRDFRAQVVIRHLDGSFELRGGQSLRTVRLADDLGPLDLARSPIASLHSGPQGRYVTFLPDGPRRLVFHSESRRGDDTVHAYPHLTRANAEVRSFALALEHAQNVSLRFELAGFLDLDFELGGLPAQASCRLARGSRRWQGRTNSSGSVKFALRGVRSGRFALSCARSDSAR